MCSYVLAQINWYFTQIVSYNAIFVTFLTEIFQNLEFMLPGDDADHVPWSAITHVVDVFLLDLDRIKNWVLTVLMNESDSDENQNHRQGESTNKIK